MRRRTRTVGLLIVQIVATLLAVLPFSTAASAADLISFRASAQSSATQPTHRVTIPASVRETDGMLLFVSTNSTATPTAEPEGWTPEGALTDTDMVTRVYSRVAAANDAGRNAAISFASNVKASVILLAYDGTAADPTASVESVVESTYRTTHAAPATSVTEAGSWVVNYWSDKSSSTTGWTVPGGRVERAEAAASGEGRVTGVAADSGAPVAVGGVGPATATANGQSGKGTMWSIVLRPDPDSAPNVAPVGSFTVSCPQLTCTVDASGSTDTAPGTIASYAWDFGDGTTGTGVTATRTYPTPGARTITLVVTDNQGLASAPVTRTANPTTASSGQNVPGHTRLVPDRPRNNTPRISNGEIWDIEVIPQLNRVFIAGNFTSAQNTTGNTATVNQAGLLSYNLSTGLIDTAFRPTFGGGGVNAVEATPDGSKLFVAGTFNTVNGVTRQKVASLNLTTGAPLTTFEFTRSTNNAAQALAATNDTLYVGGRFSRVNGQLRTGLAAVNAASGAVDMGFDNQLSGGIGVNGQLGVPQLRLTPDESKLLVVHTGRQIDGQDRYGMGLIDTRTKELLPWRSTLWDDNLARVGGVTRIYAGDIAPDGSYFVVGSGSGGDAPPISDTVVAYPLTEASLQDSNVQPLWISRHFDSIYSLAITEQAIYVGGHFGFIESPSSSVPWPGLDNVGYGTGQGLAGYGLGDEVVRRDHIAAINPVDGRALEWNPTGGSNSFEGNKAMEATPRGLFIGGDGMFQGGVRTGRVAFYDFNSVQFPPALPDTTITTPIEGRVVGNGTPFEITGTARVAGGNVGRVEVRIQDRDSGQFLQDDGTAFTTFGTGQNVLNATLSGTGSTRTWSIPATIDRNRNLLVEAAAFGTTGGGDSTRATKKFESFSLDDQTPTTSISGPSGTQTSLTFTVTGTAVDDKGVNSLSYWFRNEQNQYLQPDGTVASVFNTFRGTPDVIGAPSATWSYEVTLPHEGIWRISATATDTIGQADLRSATRDVRVDSSVVAPTLTLTAPVAWQPPQPSPATIVVAPGGTMTFSGTATDDEGMKSVEVSLRNSTTRENLGNDCTWSVNVSAGSCRISPVNISGTSYNWSWTTPSPLSPGSYSFSVRAIDDEDISSSRSLSINAQNPGDAPPDGRIAWTAPTDESLGITLTGTATDNVGVASVKVSVQDNDTGRYMQPGGTMAAAFATLEATLAAPGTPSTTWSLPLTLTSGNWRFTAYAYDTAGQQDTSTSGATASYVAYPNDDPPGFNANLGQPIDGSSFSDGKIVVTGRAEDSAVGNPRIARVDVAVINAAGQYMSSSGSFSSTNPSYRTAFLNSPGSAASNYSYTTPIIPAGTYRVDVRAVDDFGQIGAIRSASGVVVTLPENQPPVAVATVSCAENVCSFDGRGSTDENPTSLTYSWNFGGTSSGTSASSAIPVRTYSVPGTFTVTLTVRDEWGITGVTTLPVTIVEPSGNGAPAPTFTSVCAYLICQVNSSGTVDPNSGDTFSNSWNWGDGTALSTGSSPSHTYAAPGTYTVTLTSTDGWGKAATTTRQVTITEPAGNAAPVPTFTATCTGRSCAVSSSGTADPNGDPITYSWNWGDATALSSGAAPAAHLYAADGTYTITLTTTDGWGRAASTTRQVTVAPAA